MFSMWALGASNDVLDKTEVLLWLSFLLVPISIAGAYWLALFRLRSVKALRTWLETFGFSLFYWLVIPILLGVGSANLATSQSKHGLWSRFIWRSMGYYHACRRGTGVDPVRNLAAWTTYRTLLKAWLAGKTSTSTASGT